MSAAGAIVLAAFDDRARAIATAATRSRSLEVATDVDQLAGESRVVVLTGEPNAQHIAQLKTIGLLRECVVGIGTIAASHRFRRLIATRLRVAIVDVHATIIGVPGVQLLPLWSSASVAGIPLHAWAVMGHGKLGVRDRVALFVEATSALDDAADVAALVTLIDAIATDANRVLPVATFVENHRGVRGPTWLSLPCIVNAAGAEPPLEVLMNDAETAGLRDLAGRSGTPG